MPLRKIESVRHMLQKEALDAKAEAVNSCVNCNEFFRCNPGHNLRPVVTRDFDVTSRKRELRTKHVVEVIGRLSGTSKCPLTKKEFS